MSCYLRLIKRIKVTGLRNTLASTRVIAADRLVLAASGASVGCLRVTPRDVNVASHVVLATRAFA